MSRETRITLRLPSDLAETVAAEANQNNRSLNSEIVARLSGVSPSRRHLRDQFAMAAMTALASPMLHSAYDARSDERTVLGDIAVVAYGLADAMMAERQKGGAS